MALIERRRYTGAELRTKLKDYEDAEEQGRLEALKTKNEQPKKTPTEDDGYKFYYCDSENSYLLGKRIDTFYYAHWHDGLGFVWDMSRYLPWGEHVVNMSTLRKEHTYPSEPREIGEDEWFKGFLQQRNRVVDNTTS